MRCLINRHVLFDDKSNESEMAESDENVKCVVIFPFQFVAPLLPIDWSLRRLALPTTAPAAASIDGELKM